MPKKRVTEGKKTRELPKRAAHDKKRVDGVFAQPSPAKVAKKKASTNKTANKKKIVKRKKKIARKTKPTYQVMIKRAIQALNNRNGSSMFAIYRHLEENYPVPGDSFHRYVSAALKKGVADGVFTRVRASYRLTNKGKSKIGKKKSSSKKKSSESDDEGSSKKRKRSSSTSKKDKKKTEKKKKEPTKKKSRSASKGKEKEKEKEKEKTTKKRSAPKKSETSSSSSGKQFISPAGHKFRWQYMDGSWKDYEMNASDLVENAYQVYIKNPGMCDVRSVKSGQWAYQVDFLNMKQTNIQHENHTSRAIRRLPIDD